MDSNFAIKAKPGIAPRSNALRDPVAVREAADTELDPSKSVTALDNSGARRDQPAPHHDATGRDPVIDPQAQAALFNAVDVRAEHADQSPNQALMRQRAYRQPRVIDENPESVGDPHADIEA